MTILIRVFQPMDLPRLQQITVEAFACIQLDEPIPQGCSFPEGRG